MFVKLSQIIDMSQSPRPYLIGNKKGHIKVMIKRKIISKKKKIEKGKQRKREENKIKKLVLPNCRQYRCLLCNFFNEQCLGYMGLLL